MALCVQSDVEKHLQISVTADPDGVFTYLIEGAGQAIKTYLGRALEEATYTNELYDSPWGRTTLRLREYPVSAVTAVEENSVALVEGEGFQWYPDGLLARINGTRERRWQIGRKIIDVTYTAGYASGSIPDDIRNVCAQMVARVFKAGAAYAATPESIASAIKSVSLEGSDSIEYADPPDDISDVMQMTAADKTALGRYQKRMLL